MGYRVEWPLSTHRGIPREGNPSIPLRILESDRLYIVGVDEYDVQHVYVFRIEREAARLVP